MLTYCNWQSLYLRWIFHYFLDIFPYNVLILWWSIIFLQICLRVMPSLEHFFLALSQTFKLMIFDPIMMPFFHPLLFFSVSIEDFENADGIKCWYVHRFEFNLTFLSLSFIPLMLFIEFFLPDLFLLLKIRIQIFSMLDSLLFLEFEKKIYIQLLLSLFYCLVGCTDTWHQLIDLLCDTGLPFAFFGFYIWIWFFEFFHPYTFFK